MVNKQVDLIDDPAMVAKYSVVRALAVLGDTWTLLIVLSAFRGTSRFTDWQSDLSIPKAVLANRLDRLVEARVFSKRPSQDGGKRMEYYLDEAGLDLWEPLAAMIRWSRHLHGPNQQDSLWFRHDRCGAKCDLILSCYTCAGGLTPFNTFAEPGPGAGLEARVDPHSRRRANSAIRHGKDALGSDEALALFGDMWAPAIVASALRGGRRFNDLVSYLRIPPLVLSMRLKELLAIGVMTRRTVEDSERFEAFHLTRKGLALFPYVALMAKWGDKWCDDGTGVPLVFNHRDCNHEYTPVFRCSACGERIHRSDIKFLDVMP